MTAPTADQDCYCDFVQTVAGDDGALIELHHVIPDDGAAHTEDLFCPCVPDVTRVDPDLIVVDHRDQDLDIALIGEGESCTPSDASTGTGSGLSAPGCCSSAP